LGFKRGNLTSLEDRQHILCIVDEACRSGASLQACCDVLEMSLRTFQRWKTDPNAMDKRRMRQITPHNKLSLQEEAEILRVVNQRSYEDCPPSKIVPLLADEGKYLASESTMYRLLKRENQLKHRSASKPRSVYKPQPVIATGPNQVYSWDITYLLSSIKGCFFYLYLFMDIYSRKIVGYQVYERESSDYAADTFEEICLQERVSKDQVILHSDNGSPMKGATMLATLQRLGVIPSFSRPGVSNDNPYSEALFRTLKYSSKYPCKPFENVLEAREWIDEFVYWYNNKHLHSGIKFVTPQQRHAGIDQAILEHREKVYAAAKMAKPSRWIRDTRNWKKDCKVYLNPEKGKSCSKELKAVG